MRALCLVLAITLLGLTESPAALLEGSPAENGSALAAAPTQAPLVSLPQTRDPALSLQEIGRHLAATRVRSWIRPVISPPRRPLLGVSEPPPERRRCPVPRALTRDADADVPPAPSLA
jgi:hypothetical protein